MDPVLCQFNPLHALPNNFLRHILIQCLISDLFPPGFFWTVTQCGLEHSCEHVGWTSCFQSPLLLQRGSRVYQSLQRHVPKIAISIALYGLCLLYRLHTVQGTDNSTVIRRHVSLNHLLNHLFRVSCNNTTAFHLRRSATSARIWCSQPWTCHTAASTTLRATWLFQSWCSSRQIHT